VPTPWLKRPPHEKVFGGDFGLAYLAFPKVFKVVKADVKSATEKARKWFKEFVEHSATLLA